MKVLISDVVVEERRRQDMGDIEGLAASIDRYGLLHPIVVDSNNRLVAGERRLRACEELGWREIDAKALGDLTESERREIELEENLRRKDLTEFEVSRYRVELADAAAEVLAEGVFTDSVKTPSKGGRPPKDRVPQARVAERIGTPLTTIREAQQHVETAASFPFMQTWKQYHVLEAKEALADIPAEEKPKLATLINQPGIPAKDAIAIIRNLTAKEPEERAQIYVLAASSDSRERSTALTQAAEAPAMPDPRLVLLNDAKRLVRKAARMFPDDSANEAIETIVAAFEPAYSAIQECRNGTK